MPISGIILPGMAQRDGIATWEGGVLLSLCLIAALRVFIFSAAFPLFNNVDERAHFDLVRKYALGRAPKGLEPYGRETAELLALYGSPEYYYRAELFDGRPVPPPAWSVSPQARAKFIDKVVAGWRDKINHDATQPPVYYAIAAGWYRLAPLLGMDGGRALYWIRFMNIAVIVLLVGAAYYFISRAYPGRLFLRLGAPLLLAFLPQDMFYSITNDALGPLFFAIAFYGLLELSFARLPGYGLCAWAGFWVALTVLTKLSNIAIVGVLGAVLVFRLRELGRARSPRDEASRLAVLCAAALAPILAWAARNQLMMGDLTGSSAKARYLGWTLKPFSSLWRHPLFTPGGLWFFADELLKSFWRGEFLWHGERLAAQAPAVDRFYVFSSLACLAAAALAPFAGRGQEADQRRLARGMSFLALALSILFLAGVSVAYDFGDCPYPSRQAPFMFSGRLIGGVLVPFLVLYLDGLERLLSRTGAAFAPWATLAATALVMAGSQLVLSWDVFGSAYNWFHL